VLAPAIRIDAIQAIAWLSPLRIEWIIAGRECLEILAESILSDGLDAKFAEARSQGGMVGAHVQWKRKPVIEPDGQTQFHGHLQTIRFVECGHRFRTPHFEASGTKMVFEEIGPAFAQLLERDVRAGP